MSDAAVFVPASTQQGVKVGENAAAGSAAVGNTVSGRAFAEVVSQARARSVAQLGGKAYGLLLLGRDGVPVPAWFCVTTGAWDLLEKQWGEGVQAALCDIDWASARSIAIASERLRQLAMDVALPEPLHAAISAAVSGLRGGSFAVRSSATLEDSGSHSFAGQLDSYLHVPPQDVILCVRRCWASAFTERCLSYAHHHGIAPGELQVAVVVQEMVDSRAAGVLFTADPAGASEDLIIAAGYGLGEGVVSDRVETDTYRQKADGTWEDRIATKTQRVARASVGHGTEVQAVEASWSQLSVLSGEQKQELAELGRRIAEQRGAPQDIEWAYDREGRLFITQTRPITTLSGPVAVYDNSNVVESYPGITLPLTFSHVRHGYEELFRRAVLRLGVPPGRVREEHGVFENLVGHVCGRVYYNLSNWYRMFALVPGTERYLPVWEKMLGIDQPLPASQQQGLSRYLGMSKVASRFAWGCVQIQRDLERLRERFSEERRRFRQLDLENKSLAELLEIYDGLNARMLPDWDLTLLNDGYAFLFSGLCRGLLRRSGCPEDGFVDLVAAGGQLESVLPVQALEELARLLDGVPEVRERVVALLESEPKQAVQAFRAQPQLAAALERYLEQWGDRSLGELKLESQSFAQAPEELLRLVVRYSQQRAPQRLSPSRPSPSRPSPSRPSQANASRQSTGQQSPAQQRTAQQSKLQQAHAQHRSSSGPSASLRLPRLWPSRVMLGWLTKAARRSIRLRESSRFDRARAFGMFRSLFGAVGRRLQREGVLESERDVFYLEIPELREMARRGGRRDWRALVAQRKARLERLAKLEPPPRITLRGPAERYLPPLPAAEGSGAALTGQACSSGQVQAKARVVLVPDYSIDATGQILVAPATDPGWVFLMAKAAGLVVEKGSLLSHSAIVGRELGIPTVVGVQGATRRIRTGQELLVDGSRGTVEVLGSDIDEHGTWGAEQSSEPTACGRDAEHGTQTEEHGTLADGKPRGRKASV